MARSTQVSRMGTGLGKRRRPSNWTRTSVKKRASKPQVQSAAIVRLRRNDFGFPDTMITKFKYCDISSLSGAAGVIANNTFRLNSAFDPDLTFAGHQPMWYDQFLGASAGSAPYKNYRVLSSKLKVQYSYFNPPATVASNIGPVLVGIIPSTSSTLLPSTVGALMESDLASTKILCDKSGANNVKTCYASYSPQRDLGLDAGDDTISALYNASPTQVYYAHIFKIDSTATSVVQIYITLEMDVELFQRNEVLQS